MSINISLVGMHELIAVVSLLGVYVVTNASTSNQQLMLGVALALTLLWFAQQQQCTKEEELPVEKQEPVVQKSPPSVTIHKTAKEIEAAPSLTKVDTEGCGLLDSYLLKQAIGGRTDPKVSAAATDPLAASEAKSAFMEEILSGGALRDRMPDGLQTLQALS